jgi:hypothetical protein
MDQSGVAIEDLLLTFGHAIMTAFRLGIVYIWIDCFCIIQEPEDWAREASRMSEVYSNSILNIGATAAEVGFAGCFADRDSDATRPFLTYFKARPDDSRSLCTVWANKEAEYSDFERSVAHFFPGPGSSKSVYYARECFILESSRLAGNVRQ